jgi:hypothetical protein
MDIVTREEWGAVPPTGSSTGVARLAVPTKDLILHHAGSSGGAATRVRAIQRYHMQSQGWGDIAYHYLIDSDGTVYEGVGGGIRGAATFGQNLTSHALCLLGNFNTEHPTPRALGSLVEVIEWGHGRDWWPNRITGGHRDFRSTSCPGTNLYRLIPTINERVTEDVMTPEQEAKLDQVLALTKTVPERTWGFKALSGTQAGARINMHRQVDRTYGGVTDLWSALQSGKLTEMSDTELARIQDAVADERASRLLP